MTQQKIQLAGPQQAVSGLALRGFQAHPSNIIILGFFSHLTRVDIVCDVFWFYGCLPPMPNVEFVKTCK